MLAVRSFLPPPFFSFPSFGPAYQANYPPPLLPRPVLYPAKARGTPVLPQLHRSWFAAPPKKPYAPPQSALGVRVRAFPPSTDCSSPSHPLILPPPGTCHPCCYP